MRPSALRGERRVLVFKQHQVAIGAQQDCPERVMRVPQLHIGGVGRVSDVERIEHQDAAIVAVDKVVGQPVPAKFTHGWKVWQFQPGRFPF